MAAVLLILMIAWFSVAAQVLALFLAWAALLSAATYRRPQLKFGLVIGFVLLVAVGNGGDPYKLSFTGLEAYYRNRTTRVDFSAAPTVIRHGAAPGGDGQDGADVAGGRPVGAIAAAMRDDLLDDQQVLERWLAKRSAALKAGQKPKLVVVAVSGGGIAAAVWTALNLRLLESILPKAFPEHVRLVTGASGGMLGASYYVASLREGADGDVSARGGRDLVADLRADSLTPVVRRLIFADAVAVFFPWRQYHDRGRILEQAWVENTGGERHSALAEHFRGLSAREAEGWLPSLVLSPTLAEDATPLLISNLDLGQLNRVEFFKLFPESSNPDAQRLRISTAVRMNATFPFVSPAVSLPTEGPRHIVDAGYVDNYGVLIASDWIYENREWLAAKTSGVIMIQIRAFPDVPAGRTGGLRERLYNGFGPLLTPFDVYTAANRRAMMERDEERIRRVERWFRSGPNKPRFQSVALECPRVAALSWVMTDEDYESMSLFPNVYTSLYASLYRLFQDPYKIPTESDMSDRIQAVNLRMRRTRYGYRRVAKDYQRRIHHIWAIFKYHEYDRLWADDLNPEIDEKVRESLEELKTPEDEINDIIEGR